MPILNNKAKLEGHDSNHNAYFTLFSQVGACIISPNKQIKAVEYSGEPDGLVKKFKDKAKQLYPDLDLKVIKEFCKCL